RVRIAEAVIDARLAEGAGAGAPEDGVAWHEVPLRNVRPMGGGSTERGMMLSSRLAAAGAVRARHRGLGDGEQEGTDGVQRHHRVVRFLGLAPAAVQRAELR